MFSFNRVTPGVHQVLSWPLSPVRANFVNIFSSQYDGEFQSNNRRKFSKPGDGSIMEACVIHQDQSLGEGDCHHIEYNVPTQSYDRALALKFIFVSIFKSGDTKLVKN